MLFLDCADGSSEGCSGQDDSVSEEDGSFDELTEGTPYLQPEVDLSTLNQVSNQVFKSVCVAVGVCVCTQYTINNHCSLFRGSLNHIVFVITVLIKVLKF